jgi:GNAT superfamily N-acetyltransferase
VPELWGKRGFYCPEWGNAAEGQDARRIYEEMYTQLSARWVANGCFTHAVGVFAHDRTGIDAWNWLGFGLVVGDAVRGLEPVDGRSSQVEIGQATHNAYSAWIRDPGKSIWLARHKRQPVGYMRFGPASTDACDIIVDVATASNTGAYVRDDVRGRGIGAALLDRGISWARSRGFVRCAVDFETANVLGSRFWMRHFRPVSFGMARQVDERIAWSHGERAVDEMW